MKTELLVGGISLLLFFLACGGSLVAFALRHRPQLAPSGPAIEPPRSVAISKPQPYTRRSAKDRQAEAQLIRAALAAGLDPAWLAKALRGNPIYNRRRITTVARQAEQAVTV